jgi:integrase
MTKYNPSKDLPDFVREYKTLRPSELAEIVLNRRNEKISPESVTMWFKRHPEIYEALAREVVSGLPTAKEAVSASIFEPKAFEEIPSVKEWILYMHTRRIKGKPLHPEYIKEQVGILRRALREHSVLLHPDRLSFHDAQEIFKELEDKGMDTYSYRRAIKDFLKSKGSARWEQIGVGKPLGFGQYKTLFVERDAIHRLLDWIKTQDFEVYVIDQIMWHNGIRLNAVLNAKIEGFKPTPDGWATLTVLEKFRKTVTFTIIPEVASLIKQVIGARTSGKIFSVRDVHVDNLNRKALDLFVPNLKIPMPSHFFRHMCAQHLKRMVGASKAASIMKTTLQSFMESYGGDTEEEVEKWTRESLPKLDPDQVVQVEKGKEY